MEEAALAAGARQVHLIEEPIAAAIGAGVAIEEPVGRMVVDVGGGTSEMAVISLGGIVNSRSVRVGGYELDEAIAAHLRNHYQLAIGSQTAESIKIAIGSVTAQREEQTVQVRGRHLLTGLPTAVTLSAGEVREAIRAPIAEILRAIRDTLEETPARARLRHRPRRHPARRRRHPDPRLRRAGGRGDRHAGVQRRVAAHLRRVRLRPGAGPLRSAERSAPRHRRPAITPDWRTA